MLLNDLNRLLQIYFAPHLIQSFFFCQNWRQSEICCVHVAARPKKNTQFGKVVIKVGFLF